MYHGSSWCSSDQMATSSSSLSSAKSAEPAVLAKSAEPDVLVRFSGECQLHCKSVGKPENHNIKRRDHEDAESYSERLARIAQILRPFVIADYDISETLRDLILRMLPGGDQDTISASRIFRHPWVVGYDTFTEFRAFIKEVTKFSPDTMTEVSSCPKDWQKFAASNEIFQMDGLVVPRGYSYAGLLIDQVSSDAGKTFIHVNTLPDVLKHIGGFHPDFVAFRLVDDRQETASHFLQRYHEESSRIFAKHPADLESGLTTADIVQRVLDESNLRAHPWFLGFATFQSYATMVVVRTACEQPTESWHLPKSFTSAQLEFFRKLSNFIGYIDSNFDLSERYKAFYPAVGEIKKLISVKSYAQLNPPFRLEKARTIPKLFDAVSQLISDAKLTNESFTVCKCLGARSTLIKVSKSFETLIKFD